MINETCKDAELRMGKSVESLESNFAKIRTGRAHPSILDSIRVNYYGSDVPISQVANINLEDARTLMVQPWEQPMIAVVEKAIMQADLGINPATTGNIIRLPMPPLTEERRKEFIKVARADAENAKVAIRNIRRDSNADFKEFNKSKDITDDESRSAEDRVQKLTDKFIEKIDALLAEKEKSLIEV